jgi:hypothetical protein
MNLSSLNALALGILRSISYSRSVAPAFRSPPKRGTLPMPVPGHLPNQSSRICRRSQRRKISLKLFWEARPSRAAQRSQSQLPLLWLRRPMWFPWWPRGGWGDRDIIIRWHCIGRGSLPGDLAAMEAFIEARDRHDQHAKHERRAIQRYRRRNQTGGAPNAYTSDTRRFVRVR